MTYIDCILQVAPWVVIVLFIYEIVQEKFRLTTEALLGVFAWFALVFGSLNYIIRLIWSWV